jgi:hypothetical protein
VWSIPAMPPRATAPADYANLDVLAFDVLDLLDPW